MCHFEIKECPRKSNQFLLKNILIKSGIATSLTFLDSTTVYEQFLWKCEVERKSRH